MPLVTSGSIGAKKAEAILRRHATSGLAGLTAFTNRQRNERLERFLKQQEAMGQWEASCAALADASLHNVPVHEENVLSAMRCCGLAGRSKAVQTLFYKGYKHLKLTKTTSSEIAFMDACAASGDFAAAHERMTFLIKRDERPPRTPPPAAQPSPQVSQLSSKTLAQWSPKLSTDVLVAYLTAAQQSERPVKLSAPAENSSSAASRPGVDATELVAVAPWSAALAMFVRLRATPATRPRTELTPLVLQQLSELADRGGQWEAAVKVVTGASAMHCLVPPESYDAAIRAAYRTKQHHHIVVRLVERCLATRTPPSEQSVRMALRSTEEVAASQTQDALTSTIPLMAGFLADASTDSAAATPSVPAAWALSLRLYQGLKDNGLALLPQTFEVPIRACCLSGKWDAAAKILGDMKVTFGRRVPQHAYRVVLLSKIEHAPSYDVAKRLSLIPVIDQTSGAKYIAMLRCCARLGDWKHFKVIRNEMKQLEIPESYETMKLQMLLALADNNPHAVATRYVRWMQLTGFERDRVVTDATVPLHEDDFAIDGATLRLVVSACERLMKVDKEAQQHRATGEGKGGVGRTLDPVVAVAHADALKRLSGGKDLLQGAVSPSHSSSVLTAEGGALPSWLFRNQPESD